MTARPLRTASLVLVAALAATGTLALSGLQALSAAALTPTADAATIPAAYLLLYQDAAGRCPLPWTLLAAVGAVESDHGKNTATSSAGAVGPMQFQPATWARYRVDGNGDGRADPTNPADAIPAAADYLCALGAATAAHDALIAYNCGNTSAHCQAVSAGYAASVTALAARLGAPVSGAGPTATLAVQTALAQVGTPYLWGGSEPGGFDCSGLVQWAYARAGVLLPRTAQQQYQAGPLLPVGATAEPGDLLFFGAGPGAVDHVGIALGDGRMVAAPHTGALVRIQPVAPLAAEFVGATRPAAVTAPQEIR